MNGQVGSPNALPWPSIDCVVDSGVELQRLFESGATALVTEKLDGSNLCLHSNGVVASRRTVLANNSSLKDFKSLRYLLHSSFREGRRLRQRPTYFAGSMGYHCKRSLYR